MISLGSGKRQIVLEGGYFGRYVDGHLIFVRNRALASVEFDPGSLRVNGTPVSVPLDVEINLPNGWAALAAAPNGTLAYRTDALKDIVLTWSDEEGNEEAAVDSSGRFRSAVPSPDGKKIAVVRDDDVWVFDRQRALFSRLTDSEQMERFLVWSPDSREIFYVRDVPQYDIFKRVVDGSRAEELVVTSPSDKGAMSISPDGRTLLYTSDISGSDDIYATSPTPSDRARPTPIITGRGAQMQPSFSPDGAWISYTSDESGRAEVFLAPFPVTRGPARQQVSVGGGFEPQWAPDGRVIYYTWSGRIMKARVDPRSGEIGRPELLRRIQPVIGWTVAPDGRFLLGRAAKNSERHSIKVVLNWAATLRDAGKQ